MTQLVPWIWEASAWLDSRFDKWITQLYSLGIMHGAADSDARRHGLRKRKVIQGSA
jgi:hypothetical protein